MSVLQDLYGSDIESLEVARIWVENALGITLAAHDSLYRGGDYYRWDGPGGEELVLQINSDGEEPAYQESKLHNPRILLFVKSPREPERTRSALTAEGKFVFLERSEM